MVGDWDGDGQDEIGVFRAGRFILDRNADGAIAGDARVWFGAKGQPIAGNWNGAPGDEIGVFHGGTWKLDSNHNRRWGKGDRIVTYGGLTDRPIVGDWNHDGRDDVGVYRAKKAELFLDADADFRFDDAARIVSKIFVGARPIVGAWNPAGQLLTEADLPPLVSEALARWQNTGLTESQIALLQAASFVITDQSGSTVAETLDGVIHLDRDAAGQGWFVDPTPATDEEFVPG